MSEMKEFTFRWEFGIFNRIGVGDSCDGEIEEVIISGAESCEDGDKIMARKLNDIGDWMFVEKRT